MDDVNVNIPIFPLNIFLLPGEYTQLYIFEERYKQLIKDCMEQSLSFGIAYTQSSNTLYMGSLVEVTQILHTYPGGEMDIMIRAGSSFVLNKFFSRKEGKLYPGGEVIILDHIQNKPASMALIRKYQEYLIDPFHNRNGEARSFSLGIFDIANELLNTDYDKLEFMELTDSNDRDQYLINYLSYLKMIQDQEKSVYKNIFLN